MPEEKEDKINFVKSLWEYMLNRDNFIGSKIGDQKKRQGENLDSIIFNEKPTINQYGPEAIAFALSRSADVAGDKLTDATIGKAVEKAVTSNGYKSLGKVAKAFGMDPSSAVYSANTILNEKGKDAIGESLASANKAQTKINLEGIDHNAKTYGNIDKGIKKGKFVEVKEEVLKKQKNQVLKEAKEMSKAADTLSKVYKYESPETQKIADDIFNEFAKKYAYTPKGNIRKPEVITRMVERDPEYISFLDDLKIIDFDYRNNNRAGKISKNAVIGTDIGKVAARTTENYIENMPERNLSEKKDNTRKVDFDPRFEKGKFYNGVQNLTDSVGANYLGTNRLNNDEINELIHIINDGNNGWGNYINKFQLDRMSMWDKKAWLAAAARGDFDTENEKLSYIIREARRKQNGLTNKEETKE